MKRCPECRRDYTDETLNFCLDDGAPLVDCPAFGVPPLGGSPKEQPATVILSEPGTAASGFPDSESPTRRHIRTTDQTAIFPTGAEAKPQNISGDHSARQSLSETGAAKPQGKFGSRHNLVLISGIAVFVLTA